MLLQICDFNFSYRRVQVPRKVACSLSLRQVPSLSSILRPWRLQPPHNLRQRLPQTYHVRSRQGA
jgi:hypothetical protein